MILKFTILGAPRTKKTSNRIIIARGRRRILPSAAWESWAAEAVLRINAQMARLRARTPLPDTNYNCRAHFYRDARRGDAVGYYQGLADVLEKAQVVTNDKYITQWDGSRLLVDRANPRVELTLTDLDADSTP